MAEFCAQGLSLSMGFPTYTDFFKLPTDTEVTIESLKDCNEYHGAGFRQITEEKIKQYDLDPSYLGTWVMGELCLN